jgi:hypothetical protein
MVSPAPLLTRNNNLIQDIIIVDGIPGCGKTMVSAIISSLDRVELMKFCYDIEYYCILNHYNNINLNVAQSMIKLKVDQLIYDLMMSREVNFRYSDLSSVFKTSNKLRYFKRIFQKGDQVIPDRIKKEKPILHLTTHMMSAFNLPILKALNKNITFLSMHRDPIYMIKQNIFNVKNLYNTPRDFQLYYKYKKNSLPFYTKGWEKDFINSNGKERSIFYLEWIRKKIIENKKNNILFNNFYEFTFESFVQSPEYHLNKINKFLKTNITRSTKDTLKRERIPRKLISDGRNLEIYRRVGWKKIKAKNKVDEYIQLYNWAYKDISRKAKKSLDWLISDYKILEQKINEI